MPESKVKSKEIGAEGLDQFYGNVTEVYNPLLQWPGVYSTYNEMRRRDPTLRAIFNIIGMLAKQAEWKAEKPSDEGANTEAADFLDECLADMSHTPGDLIDDALTCLPFGWASNEICYKRREGPDGKYSSQFTDGKVGWRKFAPRRQSTLDKWLFDDDGGWKGWTQRAPPGYEAVDLPIEKLLHFTCTRDGGNPEGISLFESAYEPWHYVTNLQIIGGIGWQRAFVGLPVFVFEQGPGAGDLTKVQNVAESLFVNEKQYVIVPPNVTFSLETTDTAGAVSLLETIRFYRVLMAQLVFADFIFLGSANTGSWALGSDKTQMFLQGVNGYLDRIADVWTRFGVKRLFELNGMPTEDMPAIGHTTLRKTNLPELAEFVAKVAPQLAWSPEDALWLRELAGMPTIDLTEQKRREAEKEKKTRDAFERQGPPGQGPFDQQQEGGDDDGEMAELADPDDPGREEARKRLEQQLTGSVRGFLGEQRGRVEDELTWAEWQGYKMPPEFWKEEEQLFRASMLGDLTKHVNTLIGWVVADAEATFAGGADWTMVNVDAAKWARRHVGGMIRGITATTRRATKEAVASWVEAGAELPDLTKALEPYYGKARAELIGTTEVTRAYGEANDLVRQATGLPAAAYKEPAHPRCRCWTRSELLPNGDWVVVWQTARDDVVCQQPLDTPWGTVNGCTDLQGRVVSEGGYLGTTLSEARGM